MLPIQAAKWRAVFPSLFGMERTSTAETEPEPEPEALLVMMSWTSFRAVSSRLLRIAKCNAVFLELPIWIIWDLRSRLYISTTFSQFPVIPFINSFIIITSTCDLPLPVSPAMLLSIIFVGDLLRPLTSTFIIEEKLFPSLLLTAKKRMKTTQLWWLRKSLV